MPLFESQEARTNRLFDMAVVWAHGRARALLEPPSLQICEGLLLGGFGAAHLSLKYEPLRRLWGKGDELKAVFLAKIFSLAMLSAYLAPVEGGDVSSMGERDRALRDWGTVICQLFGDENAEGLEYFLAVDRQHTCDRAEERPSPLSDAIYLSAAIAALGGRAPITLGASELPITDYTYEHLVARGVVDLAGLPDWASRNAFRIAATGVFGRAAADIERLLARHYEGTPEAQVHLRKAEEIERSLEQAGRKLKQLRQD